MLKYKKIKNSGLARRGRLTTAHGMVELPTFMAVGTAGTVKAMSIDALKRTGTQIVLGNTYHLMLRPSAERVAKFGGLHKFMNWEGPILTDSGGFQVMSLSGLRKITEKGTMFQSHLSGEKFELTPERSIEIQHLLGSDISMAFDECLPYPSPEKKVAESMRRSMRWAQRSKNAFKDRDGYGLFGIVQGGMIKDLRLESVEALKKIDFDGYAVGGLAVGEGQAKMFEVLDYTVPELPEGKPRYLMGVGRPSDIVGAVARGIDMFDCVMPSRSGRTGQAFTSHGVINIRNSCYQDDHTPLDIACDCPACKHYTRGYLHHLFRCGEILGAMLMTEHNLRFYQNLMAQIREAIEQDKMADFVGAFQEKYKDDRKM